MAKMKKEYRKEVTNALYQATDKAILAAVELFEKDGSKEAGQVFKLLAPVWHIVEAMQEKAGNESNY